MILELTTELRDAVEKTSGFQAVVRNKTLVTGHERF
jgi:hypothetical protein